MSLRMRIRDRVSERRALAPPVVLVALGAALIAACGAGDGAPVETPSERAPGGPADAGAVPTTATAAPNGDASINECGSEDAQPQPIPPNLLVVLDRSCSMDENVGATGKTKWQIAVEAIGKLTAAYAGKVRFGLTMFPDHDGADCDQSAIPIPVHPTSESAIQALLNASLSPSDANYPRGPCVTNIDTAMKQAQTEPAFADKTRNSYVALITDGGQSGCESAGGDSGTEATIKALAASGVATFAVGFGTGVETGPMERFAAAGGVPNANGPHRYYDAADGAALDAALATIAKHALGCELVLSKKPRDAEKVYVFFDKTRQVARDPSHAQGWDYDPMTNVVTFYGDACNELKATVAHVDVVFGCPNPSPK